MPTPRFRTVTAQITVKQAKGGGFTLEITAPADDLPPILDALYHQCTAHGLDRQAIAQSIGNPRTSRGKSAVTLRINRPPGSAKSPVPAPSDPTDPAA